MYEYHQKQVIYLLLRRASPELLVQMWSIQWEWCTVQWPYSSW